MEYTGYLEGLWKNFSVLRKFFCNFFDAKPTLTLRPLKFTVERKGITPVVAVVLLIAITIGGTATVYQIFEQTQNQAQQFEPSISLNSDSLSIESCWNETPETLKLSIRNSAAETVNTTRVPMRVAGEGLEYGVNYSVNQGLVDPQNTFTVTMDPSVELTSETRIDILTSSETIEYRCRRLPAP